MKTLSITQVNYIIAEMVKAHDEIIKARNLGDFEDCEQYIAFREGIYDGYLDVLYMLGYRTDEIENMEEEQRQKLKNLLKGRA